MQQQVGCVEQIVAAKKGWTVFKHRFGGTELRRPVGGDRRGKRGGLLHFAYVLACDEKGTGLHLRGVLETGGPCFTLLFDSSTHTPAQLVAHVLKDMPPPGTMGLENDRHPAWGILGDMGPPSSDNVAFPEDDDI